MLFIRIFWIFLIFVIASCGYLNKPSSSKDQKEDKVIFVGEVSPLTKAETEVITKKIDGILLELKGFCKAPSQLQTVKGFVVKLQELKNYANLSYSKKAYSFKNVTVKDGTRDVNLGIYLLDINSILTDAYAMEYGRILKSTNFKEACKKLKGNYTFSYAAHYNLADNVNIKGAMSFLFKNIYDSIKCTCR